jgi:type VI secretion system protein ImpL
MKKMLLKILKWFLILATVFLALLLMFGLVVFLGWPWWVGLFIILGIAGIWIGILFIRKMIARRREQNFVQQVIDQDNYYTESLGSKDKERSRELQDRWKEAIHALRKSHLKKLGNPLYVLPWYMIIGESASGKTTAIKSARLSSPFAELSRTSGISGTRNVDWWFFEQAIILDTAGRYAIPVDEGRDKDEWQKFLSYLVKFRKKEPINGLVVTVAANKLLEPKMEELEDDGRNIRRRIDELMRVLGAKFPIYLMITKCDLIQGMTQFCNHLPETKLDQAMGFLNQDMSRDVFLFYERAMGAIGERLRDLRLLIFQKSGSGIDPELLLFPEEFEKIKPGLESFMKGAFQENPYQETPVLRGIFYSSGRQEGSPYSHFLSSLGLIEQRDVLPGTNKGLFLKDFFTKILPKDRDLFTPTQRTLEWGRLTRNLGLTSFVAIVLALCGMLSFSFVKNLSTLKDAAKQFSPPPVLQGEVLSDVVTMDNFCQAILDVEERNRNWWIPRFWLTESIRVEKELKDKYCSQFKDGFLVSFDKQMSDRMTGFSPATSDEMIGQHVAHLVRRINLLHARLEGKEFDNLKVKPQPSFDTIVVSADKEILPELKKRFEGLYLYNLVWREDTSRLNQEMNTLQSWLKHVINLRPDEMHWLVGWMNQELSVLDITLADFWGGSLSAPLADDEVAIGNSGQKDPDLDSNRIYAPLDEIKVSGAYTIDGKETIASFITEMEEALPEPIIIAGRKTEFERWYKNAYLKAWYDFGVNFNKGKDRLADRSEWQEVAVVMGTDQGPYFLLLDVMAEQLEPFRFFPGQDTELPLWVDLVNEFKSVRSVAGKETNAGMETLKRSGIFRRTTAKVKSKIDRFKGETGLKTKQQSEETLQSRMVAANAYENYDKALQDIRSVTTSRRVAFSVAQSVFGENSSSGKLSFLQARDAVTKLKTAMAEKPPEQEMFWNLVRGPWEFMWDYSVKESACHLGELWEEEVLVEVQGISDLNTMSQLLLGRDGFAVKFIEGPAAPFLSRSLKKGYYAKQVLGEKIPFTSSFLNFITKGSIAVKPTTVETVAPAQSSYTVTIRGLPTDVNPEARIRPHATTLEVKCVSGTFRMTNLNFPVRKTFEWSPNTCGDVFFSIEVGNLALTRKYTGDQAFPRFLRDFANGQRTFYPKNFPEHEDSLNRLGIDYIKVNYRFIGDKPILRLLRKKQRRLRVPSLPRNIVRCWDQ